MQPLFTVSVIESSIVQAWVTISAQQQHLWKHNKILAFEEIV
jgi:hypothetical protein